MTQRLHGAQLSTLQDSLSLGCSRFARWFAKVSSKRYLGDEKTQFDPATYLANIHMHSRFDSFIPTLPELRKQEELGLLALGTACALNSYLDL